MNFKVFHSKGKEVIINVDRIIHITPKEVESDATWLILTDDIKITVDDSVDYIKKQLGIIKLKRTAAVFR